MESEDMMPANVTRPSLTEQLREIVNEICQEYCKFPEKYLTIIKDEDEAEERLYIEKCDQCPLSRL